MLNLPEGTVAILIKNEGKPSFGARDQFSITMYASKLGVNDAFYRAYFVGLGILQDLENSDLTSYFNAGVKAAQKATENTKLIPQVRELHSAITQLTENTKTVGEC